MRNPFRRTSRPMDKPTPPSHIRVQHGSFAVEHVIRYEPRPRPQLLYVIFYRSNGDQFRKEPVVLTGQPYIRQNIPLSYITGRAEDNKFMIDYEIRLDYS